MTLPKRVQTGLRRTMLVACAAALASCGKPATGKYSFDTAKVDRGDVARVIAASGAVRALNTVEIGSQVSGKIVALEVDYNSTVKQGQVMARIDPQTFETQLRQAEANLMQAEASLAVQRAALTRAEATYENARKTWERQQKLYAEQAISQSALEQAERDFTFARVEVDSAKSQIQSAQASLQQRRAAVESARVDLSRTYIRSPIDGVVIERLVSEGQTVAASMSAPKLFIIAQDLSDIRIDAAVVESDIGGVDAGDAVSFTVDAYPNETFTGQIEQVRLSATTTANVVTYTAVVAARNPGARLLPGMTANVEITADKRDAVLRLPAEAVRFSPPKELAPKDAAASEGGAAAGPGGQGGGGRRGGPPTEMLKELGVDDARIAKISGEMRTEMEKLAPQRSQNAAQQFGPPPDMQAIRTKMMAAADGVMKRNLTPEEFDAYEKKRAARASVKRATLYALGENNALEPIDVMLGLSNGDWVEIVRGVDEGQVVVTRARAADAK